jgi:hypothetical protein
VDISVYFNEDKPFEARAYKMGFGYQAEAMLTLQNGDQTLRITFKKTQWMKLFAAVKSLTADGNPTRPKKRGEGVPP